MYMSYKSDYPNQVQQMNVSISKNYYLLKDGTINYQVKKFDINWKNYSQSSKRHLVTYIIRDHFSNCSYAELHSIDEMPSIEEFLFRAWSLKDDYEFYGAPETLIVPASTLNQFPLLNNFFKNVKNIVLQTPSSGFSTAIRSIRDWERSIKGITWIYTNCKTLADFHKNIQLVNRKLNTYHSGKTEPNLDKWCNGSPMIIEVGEKEQFYRLFK